MTHDKKITIVDNGIVCSVDYENLNDVQAYYLLCRVAKGLMDNETKINADNIMNDLDLLSKKDEFKELWDNLKKKTT